MVTTDPSLSSATTTLIGSAALLVIASAFLRAAKSRAAVAQETLQSLARSAGDCGAAGISPATRTVGSRNTKNSCSAVVSLSRCPEASILDVPLSERTRDSEHHSAHRAYHPLVLDRRNRSVVRPQSQTGMGR